MSNVSLYDKLIKDFTTLEGALNGQAHTSVHAVRRQAIQRFAELGFPTVRHEEWKYTSIVSAVQHDYTMPSRSLSAHFDNSAAAQTKAQSIMAEDVAPYFIPHCNASTLVFVNGVFSRELSHLPLEEEGVSILPLHEAFQQKSPSLEKHFARYAAWQNDAFVALNTAYAMNGAFIDIAPNKVLKTPLHLMFLHDARTANVFIPVRNLIVLGANAEVSIMESTHTIANDNYHSFTNSVTEIALDHNAHLHHCTLQNDIPSSYYVGATSIHQEASSAYNSAVVTLSGGIVRNNLSAVLAGKAADAHYYGLYCINGKTLVDNHTLVDHAVAHCTSNELYKGIMDERATGVFNGKIMVRQNAQKTLAYQSNRNILLSQNATINTKPQLEIFADDVKCSHGCTTGQLDEESLFYLRARGLNKEQARALLLYAFAGEILEKIKIEALKHYVESILVERLHQEEIPSLERSKL